jgi:hypothetical protein
MKMFGPMYDPGVTREIVTSGGYSIPFPTSTTPPTRRGDDPGHDPDRRRLGRRRVRPEGARRLQLRDAVAARVEGARDDSLFAMEALLGGLLGERLGRLANSQLTVGVGTTAPQGIVVGSTASARPPL